MKLKNKVAIVTGYLHLLRRAPFWTLQSDPKYTALAMEFMALANHRKAIRDEIKRYAEYSRRLQAEA
jgi:hypothetical protein